jgi:hypothetical protein
VTYISLPCPALAAEQYLKVAQYLSRTSALGGGAPSRTVIARELEQDPDINWRDLDTTQKRRVLRREESLYQWRNLHSLGVVAHSQCEQLVDVIKGEEPQPCSRCASLLRNHTFQTAINRRLPDEEKLKFVPNAYRNTALGELYIKYKGLCGLLEAVSRSQIPLLPFEV